jgi:hypothetical protein
MVRLVLLSIALLVFVTVAVALILSAVVMLALACVVGVPLYLMARPHLHKQRVIKSPIERLQNLFVEGKIDLPEFERRVAHLVRVEP